MNHKSLFFKYVIPSIIAFALSGIYAIVDGYFAALSVANRRTDVARAGEWSLLPLLWIRREP